MRVAYEEMAREFARVLEKKGFAAQDAADAADIFAQNSLAGVYSHGLNRFPRIVRYLDKGEIDPRARATCELRAGVLERWGEHVVLDCAVSQFSYGKIEDCRLRDVQLPVPGGYDTKGELTRDPAEIEKTGRVLPMGYWKGSGLSIVLDLIATVDMGSGTKDVKGGKL